MHDVARSLANRMRLTTDGHRAYLDAVNAAFGDDIDYAMLVKVYRTPADGERRHTPRVCLSAESAVICGTPDREINTSFAAQTSRGDAHRSTRLTIYSQRNLRTIVSSRLRTRSESLSNGMGHRGTNESL
jgi:hypothetical protein